jgi:hypothetical protein
MSAYTCLLVYLRFSQQLDDMRACSTLFTFVLKGERSRAIALISKVSESSLLRLPLAFWHPPNAGKMLWEMGRKGS